MPDERPDFVALAVHQKHRAPFGAGVPRGELQNNVEQFRQIERGIQPLGGFHNRGELNYRMAPLAAFQRQLCVTPEQLQPAARLWDRARPSAAPPGLPPDSRRAPAPSVQPSPFDCRIPCPAEFARCRAVSGAGARRFHAKPTGVPRRTARSAHPPDVPAPPDAHHLRGQFARIGFRIECRDHFSSVSSGEAAAAGRAGFPCHAAFPLYWITRMVMSSDCAAPSVNTRMPSRMASPIA